MLTASHERYCQERANGKSQYESMLLAYPHRKTWKRNSIDVAATKLEAKTKIKQRIAELKKPQEDLLEKHRNELIETAIKASKGELPKDKAERILTPVLNKLLDKLLASKTENKSEVTIRRIEDLIDEL